MSKPKEKSAEVIVVVSNELPPLWNTGGGLTKQRRLFTLSRFQFSKEVQIKLASLILNEAGCNWCAAVVFILNEPPYTRPVRTVV